MPDAPGASVLFVTEDAALADAVSLLLEEWGFTPLIAIDAIQALDLCRSGRPSLVLLDLTAQKAMAASFADRISREPGSRAPPVVALHSDEDVPPSLRDMPVEFVRAPFRLDDLQDALERHCVPPGGWLH